jgi:hypothetical protein
MRTDWIKRVSLALAMALGLVSCNGSVNLAEGGIGGSGISMGVVSQFGSIFVNGVEFDTTGATIVYADEGTQQKDFTGQQVRDLLSLGMVVTVRGTINPDGLTGQADSVTYADALEGPIAGPPTANTFVVLGQTVIVDNLTEFRNVMPADISGLADTDVVEVSGFVDASGDIRATYIEKKPTSSVNEVKGTVTAVTTPTTFAIGALSVNTGSSGVDANGLLGQFVEVEGSFSGGTLIASSVELGSSALDSQDHDEAEMEGIVTSVSPSPEMAFVLGGQTVNYTVDTAFNGGVATDILPGVKVEVEGSLSGGILIANEITFEDGIELEANIHSIVGNTITLDGLVTFGGLNLEVIVDDVLTEFEGVAFTALQVGDHVELRARDTGSGLLATRLSASSGSDPNTVVLQGPLLAKDRNANSVTVLGVTVDGFTVFEIDSIGNVDATIFYDTVALDDLVSLEGTWDGVTLSGDKIELDD